MEREAPSRRLSTVFGHVSRQQFTLSACMKPVPVQSRGSTQDDSFWITLYYAFSALRPEGLPVFPTATRACVKHALVLLRLKEAGERAVLHQAEDFPLSHDKTRRTRPLETLADDVTGVEIQVYLQKHVKQYTMTFKTFIECAAGSAACIMITVEKVLSEILFDFLYLLSLAADTLDFYVQTKFLKFGQNKF